MPEKNTTITVEISAATFMHITKSYGDSNDAKEIKAEKLTPLAKEHLLSHPITCYVKNLKLGESREITSEEAINLLEEDIKHIDDVQHLGFLRSLPLAELETVTLNITIKPYKNNDITEHLRNMLFLKKHIKVDSHSGKLDYNAFEKEFNTDLPRGKKISNYIDGAKKYSYTNFLNISLRNTSSKGGDKDASK